MATLRRLLVLVILLGLMLVSGSPLAPQASAQTPSDAPVRLPGHTLSALPKATKVARAAHAATADPPLTLTVVLNRADEAGFQRFLADVEDPKSANHGKFSSQAEITRRFGPSQQAYDATLAYLQQQGFTLVEGSTNRLTLTVTGARAQAEQAFAIQIGDYQLGSRSFFANDQDPAVPGNIAKNIQAVAGLSNLAQPQPNTQGIKGSKDCLYGKDTPLGAQVACGLAFGLLHVLWGLLCLDPINFITTGDSGCNYTVTGPLGIGRARSAAFSTGQKIGLLEYDTFHPSDVSAYLNLFGVSPGEINRLSTVAVNGGVASPGPGEAEVLLDIDTVITGAPRASVVVYDAPGTTSFQSLFNAMLNDGDTVISNSWSYCEDQTSLADAQSIDAIFATGAASGVSIFNASGDYGSSCLDGSPNTVGVPADAPHATAVGGTTATVGPGATYGGETWWDGSHATPATGQGGFGTSRFFSRPSYQDGLTSAPMRSVPDVVADADPSTGITLCQADAGGCPDGQIHGGTSLAAPLWAAMAAEMNQSQGHNLGALNPLLYPRANTTSFHTPASMGSDFAHVGLGSPRIYLIDTALGGVTVGPADKAISGVVALPTTVAADGTTTATIRVELVDSNGYLVSGKNVSLAASAGSHATLSAASGPSSVDNGTVLFTVKDSTIEDVTFTATDTTDGVPIQQTATVHFVSPPATTAGIAALPTTVAADGATPSTITVTLHDANGQGVSGKTVTLSQGSGHSIVTGPTPATTNSSGQVTFAARDTATETVIYTAVDVTDGNLPVPGSASVSFTNGNPPSCSNGTPTAASGYAFTNFATGFKPIGCVSPLGITFDAAGNLFVMDAQTGFLYKFGPQGGIADAGTQVNTTAIPGEQRGLVFGKDGKLYLARGNANDIVELDPATGAIKRTVASGLNATTGLVTDPLSGDLFVNVGNATNVLRIANPASATPTVTTYASPGPADGLTVAPDGTFFSALLFSSNFDIVRIAGTNTPQPAATTVVTSVPSADGIAVAANGNAPAFLFVNRNNGVITKVDLTTTPVVLSDIFTGGSRGDFAAVGPDGCFYGTQSDRVIKVTNADGTCPFAPTNVQPQIGLSPSTVTPNPPTGSPVTFTATLRNFATPSGTYVTFTVTGANPQTKLVQAEASGVVTFTYTGAFTGADTVTAMATVSTTALTSNPVPVTWAAGKDVTFISLNLSATSGAQNATTTLTASLTDVSKNPPIPIGGAPVTIGIASQTCTATTGNDGIASCSISPNVAPGDYPLVANYAGSSQYTASTATQLFRVSNLVATILTYTGPTTLTVGSPVTFTAALAAQGGGALTGKTVSLTVGSGGTTQSCSGTTDGAGTVSCTINVLNQPVGSGIITVAFAGDNVDAATTTPVNVTINPIPPPTPVSIALTGPNSTPPPATLKVGQAVQITATGAYSSGPPQNITAQVQWSSDNPGVVKVDTTGKVTGESPGTATITATLNGVSQTIMVTVGAPTPIGITVQPAPASRPGGASAPAVGAPAPAPIPAGR